MARLQRLTLGTPRFRVDFTISIKNPPCGSHRAKFNRRLWPQLDEHRGSQHWLFDMPPAPIALTRSSTERVEIPSEMTEKMKALERENRELRQPPANPARFTLICAVAPR